MDRDKPSRSTLEDLYRVKGIKPVRGLKPVARGIDEKRTGPAILLNKEAIKAYKEMIQAKHEEIIYHAYQIMKRPVITIFDTAPITDGYMLLEEKRIRQLPVMNAQNSPVGLISKEKILEKLIIEEGVIREAKAASVRELMDHSGELPIPYPIFDEWRK